MIYLVDASIYVFRAYFSVPDTLTDPHGRPVNAVYGYFRFLGDLLMRERPVYAAVAFDESLTASFRNDIYPDYKANRETPPSDLVDQFGNCRDLTRALGVAEFASPKYEADDIIGTLAAHMRGRGVSSTVVSRDKDLVQLLRKGDVLWDFAADRRVEHEDVPTRFGVRAEQFADYLALTGDAVDNIPGVRGIGPKTATVLLEHFEDLETLYARLDEVAALPIRGATGIARNLDRHREDAFLARRLTRIDCAVPGIPDGNDLSVRPPNEDALWSLMDDLGFGEQLRGLARRVAARYDSTR